MTSTEPVEDFSTTIKENDSKIGTCYGPSLMAPLNPAQLRSQSSRLAVEHCARPWSPSLTRWEEDFCTSRISTCPIRFALGLRPTHS